MSTPNRFVMAAVGLTFGAFLAYLGTRSTNTVKLPRPEPSPALTQSADPTPEPMVPANDPAKGAGGFTIYQLKMTEDGTSLEKKPFSLPDGRPEAQATSAIAAMTGEEASPLPKGTRALSVVFEGPLVTVDLSPEFKANFSGGETMEALAINALTATLGQFAGVKKVQLLVGGKKIDTLGGAQSLKEPLSVPTP